VLTDPAGRPVAVRVFPGNTADPSAFTTIVEVIRTQFGLTRLVLVGDRGMITSARITALGELNLTPEPVSGGSPRCAPPPSPPWPPMTGRCR
jgi:transposase